MNKFILNGAIIMVAATSRIVSMEPIQGFTTSLEQALIELEDLGVNSQQLEIDHVTYLATSVAKYIELQKILSADHLQMINPVVAKRAQAAFSLSNPLPIADKVVKIIEIASPWPKVLSAGQIEQVKIIVPTTVMQFHQDHPDISFDLTQLHRKGNPEISIQTASGTTFRFRELRLNQIVAGSKGAIDHPGLIAAGGVIARGNLSPEQQKALLEAKSDDLHMAELSLSGWSLSIHEISEESETRMNTDKALKATCLTGKVMLKMGDTTFTLSPGDHVEIPPGIEYSFQPVDNFKPQLLFTEVK